jgi:hypothetical protein
MNPGSTLHNLNSPLGRLSYAQLHLTPPVTQERADKFCQEFRNQVENNGLNPPLARKEAKKKAKP